MSLPIRQQLLDAAASLGAERVPVRTLIDAHGQAAHGALLMLLAVPCVLPVPGVGTALGLGLVALSLAMWRGHPEHCVPRRVADLEMPLHWARRVLTFLASVYGHAGGVARERFSQFAAVSARSWLPFVVAAMALIIVLPIPFGNVLPALSVMLIGLGLVFRDGLVVVAGALLSAVTVVVSMALIAGAWQLSSDLALRLIG